MGNLTSTLTILLKDDGLAARAKADAEALKRLGMSGRLPAIELRDRALDLVQLDRTVRPGVVGAIERMLLDPAAPQAASATATVRHRCPA